MRGGSGEIRKLMNEAVPLNPGEPKKSYFARFARETKKICASRAESLYYDPKCRPQYDEVALLKTVSGHTIIQKVHSDTHANHQIRGDELYEIIGDIKRQLAKLESQLMGSGTL